MSYVDELQAAAQELLDAEEAHRMAPTLHRASRLTRARRAVEALLPQEPAVSTATDG